MANNKINEILYLLEKNIDNDILLNSDEIQNIIDENIKSFTAGDYYKIIEFLLIKLDLNTKNMTDIFKTKPKFSIETYKKILRMEAATNFDILKSDKEELFVSLSRNICKDLKYLTPSDVIKKYKEEIEHVQEITKSSELIHLIREHKDSLLTCDPIRINETQTKIKEFTRKFNAKSKEYYIKKYIDSKIETIKDDFELKNEHNNDAFNYIGEDTFIKLFLDQNITSNNFKRTIYQYFNIEVSNNTIKQIIHNVLNNKDEENYALFDITSSMTNIEENYKKLKESVSFTRLNQNYLTKVNETFINIDKNLLITIFEDIDNINKYKQYLNKNEYRLLTEIIPIYKEALCNIEIKDNKIIFIKENELTDIEKKAIKIDYNNYKKYLGVKNKIIDYYNGASYARRDIVKIPKNSKKYDILFDDDNYRMKNVGELLNINKLFNLFKEIDKDKIESYNDELVSFLKKVIFNDGLLASVMKYDSNIDISSIINGIGIIKDFEKFKNIKKVDLEYLIKQTKLYDLADDFTISVLGSDTANKLINNRQFLQHNTKEDIKERLEKAVDLMIRAIDKNTSTIPYDIDIQSGDIKITRYKNNDPKILTSGIDTNTCFRLDGNDNDFVFYTVLNPNGAVLKIFDNHKFIGRASIFRQANVLFINGIRTINEKDDDITKEKIETNEAIFKSLKLLADNFIEQTTSSPLPIDFVVCNKAGILESSYFKENYYIVPEYIVEQPLDIYNEDWQEFIHTYDNYEKSYFMQVKEGDKVSFTTDFGHYPALLISSRDNKLLQRKFDISYDIPQDIYIREKEKPILYKKNDEDILDKIYRIDAIKHLYEIGNIKEAKKTFKRRKIENIDKVYIGEESYYIIDNKGNEEYVSLKDINKKEINKILTKRK